MSNEADLNKACDILEKGGDVKAAKKSKLGPIFDRKDEN